MKQENFPNPFGELSSLYGELSFIPAKLPPAIAINESLNNSLFTAGRNLGELQGIMIDPNINPWILMQPFFREEAVASSRLENIHTTQHPLFPLETLSISGKTVLTKEQADNQKVSNHIKAIIRGHELLKELPICGRFMRELHEVLMRDLRPQEGVPGEFRTSGNKIENLTTGEIIFVPPAVPEMVRALSALEKYINLEDQNPLIQCAVMHYYFEVIHPFYDGNGRVGRILISCFLSQKNLVSPALHLGAYFEKNKAEYYDYLLKVSQNSEWDKWINFFVCGISLQTITTLNRILKLKIWARDAKQQVGKTRRWKYLQNIVDMLIGYPIITRPIVRTHLRFSQASTKYYLEELVKEGILEKMEGYKKPYRYVCQDVLDILRVPNND